MTKEQAQRALSKAPSREALQGASKNSHASKPSRPPLPSPRNSPQVTESSIPFIYRQATCSLGMRSSFNLTVSVFVIVSRGQDLLLLRRFKTGWEDGLYSLPAGRHEGGETLAQAASRELLEETGLRVDPLCLQMAHLLHCRQGDTGGEWLGAFFLAEEWSGTPSIQEPSKHDDLGWFDVGQLPENLIPYVRQSLLLSRGQIPFSTFGFD